MAAGAQGADFDFWAGEGVAGAAEAGAQGGGGGVVVPFGDLAAARADEEQAGVVVVVPVAGDELVGAADLVRKTVVDEEAERAIDGGWGGAGAVFADAGEQVVSLDAAWGAQQVMEDLPAQGCQLATLLGTVAGGIIEEAGLLRGFRK